MKTFPLFALFLLGLASVGTAEFWDLGNIEIFRSNIPDHLCPICLGLEKATNFCEGWMGMACPPAPPLNQANWLLNNLNSGRLSCDMIYNFRQLIEHELCVARRSSITRSETIRGKGEYADLNRDRFYQLFDDTILEGSKGSFSSIKKCGRRASGFLNENIEAIKGAFAWGAPGGEGGCNIEPKFESEPGNPHGTREVLRRVINSNCVKRTFVSECWATKGKGLWPKEE